MNEAASTRQVSGFLAYVTQDDHVDLAADATRGADDSGLVIRSKNPRSITRYLRRGGYWSTLVVDPGAWARSRGTREAPTTLASSGGLFDSEMDSWAGLVLGAGADSVLTPTKFVPLDEWPVLEAVVRAGEATERAELVTMVGTDARMLEGQSRRRFIETVSATQRPLAFAFTSNDPPFGSAARLEGLRLLLQQRPDSLLVGTEPIVAADALAHGAHAVAIGVNSSARRPSAPGARSGGQNARGFVPGLFLRELWEHRSPKVYADWYANAPSPRCPRCPRALDEFEATDTDKAAVLRHNIHSWLELHRQLTELMPDDRLPRLVEERLAALIAHHELRPGAGPGDTDPVLRRLVELDTPHDFRVATGVGRL